MPLAEEIHPRLIVDPPLAKFEEHPQISQPNASRPLHSIRDRDTRSSYSRGERSNNKSLTRHHAAHPLPPPPPPGNHPFTAIPTRFHSTPSDHDAIRLYSLQILDELNIASCISAERRKSKSKLPPMPLPPAPWYTPLIVVMGLMILIAGCIWEIGEFVNWGQGWWGVMVLIPR